jgi:hypothetical protein
VRLVLSLAVGLAGAILLTSAAQPHGNEQLASGVVQVAAADTVPAPNPVLLAASAAAQKAAADIEARARVGTLPSLIDPVTAPLLHAVFDTGVLQQAPPTIGDFAALTAWSEAAGKVEIAYLSTSTGYDATIHGDAAQQAKARVSWNLQHYSTEYGRCLDTQLILALAGSKLVTDRIAIYPAAASNPKVQDMLGHFGGNLKTALDLALSLMSTPIMGNGWGHDRLVAMQLAAPQAAKLLSPSDAAALRKTALDLAQSLHDPDVQAGLKRFAAAFPG